MPSRLVFLLVLSLGIATGPVAAQVVTVGADSRGIPTIAPLIDAVDDAVVNIAVVSERPAQMTPLFRDPFFQPFLPPLDLLPPQRQMSAGSGVIVDADKGYVLTNNHVVENADEIRVTLRDNRSFEAELVGRDPATDIAVLRIEADNLTEIPLGNSENLLVGDFVVAIGNPFGLGQTVTSGIVSALGRSGINPEGYEDFIQTDASINPGNSGGALLTLDGKLIGINTAIIAPNGGGNVGIGFAVPINMAVGVMEQLVEFGEVQRGRLGVMIQDLTPDLADALDVKAATGAVIISVEPGTPADDAGLAAGDVVVAVNGETVEGSADLRRKIGLRRPGDKVEIAYLRDGARRTAHARRGGRSAPARPRPRRFRRAGRGAPCAARPLPSRVGPGRWRGRRAGCAGQPGGACRADAGGRYHRRQPQASGHDPRHRPGARERARRCRPDDLAGRADVSGRVAVIGSAPIGLFAPGCQRPDPQRPGVAPPNGRISRRRRQTCSDHHWPLQGQGHRARRPVARNGHPGRDPLRHEKRLCGPRGYISPASAERNFRNAEVTGGIAARWRTATSPANPAWFTCKFGDCWNPRRPVIT
jgi:Do/DeqQ family serine protease